MLIDTHCHLSNEDYDNLNEVINEMKGIMIISGCDTKSNKEVLDIVNKYSNVYGTLGIHPEEIDDISDSDFIFIEKNINNPKIVAIGEIGLDYYFRKDNIDKQKEVLTKQLDIAQKYNKPVVIHSREAIQDTYDLLKKYNLTGTIHCFSSSLEMANAFIKLGYKIGVGGIITFKNSKKLREIVSSLDLENILLETDSPYLTPEPLRGQKNKPFNVELVAQKISEIKSISKEEVINITGNTAKKVFDLHI